MENSTDKDSIIIKDNLQIHHSAFVSPHAYLAGDITMEEYSSIWPGVVARGDMDYIVIGKNTNIQDNSVIHVDKGSPSLIGSNVVVGHSAVIHGAKIGDNCLIAIGSILLNGVEIGEESIIGAGTLITPGTIIPPRSVVFGSPGKVCKKTTGEQLERLKRNVKNYINYAAAYKRAAST